MGFAFAVRFLDFDRGSLPLWQGGRVLTAGRDLAGSGDIRFALAGLFLDFDSGVLQLRRRRRFLIAGCELAGGGTRFALALLLPDPDLGDFRISALASAFPTVQPSPPNSALPLLSCSLTSIAEAFGFSTGNRIVLLAAVAPALVELGLPLPSCFPTSRAAIFGASAGNGFCLLAATAPALAESVLPLPLCFVTSERGELRSRATADACHP